MRVPDEDILRQIDMRFPIRARLVTRHNGDKGRFELTDANGSEVQIDGVSGLRIIALLRLHNYMEVIEEIVAFDCELVFSKPVGRPAKSTKRPYCLADDYPRIRQFI